MKKNVSYIMVQGQKVKLTFRTLEKSTLPPRWVRRFGLIAFSPIAWLEICFYQKYSFADFILGMKSLWNLK